MSKRHCKAQASNIWRRFQTMFVSAQMCLTGNAVYCCPPLLRIFDHQARVPIPFTFPPTDIVQSLLKKKKNCCSSLARAYRLLHAQDSSCGRCRHKVPELILRFGLILSDFLCHSDNCRYLLPCDFAFITPTITSNEYTRRNAHVLQTGLRSWEALYH